MAPRQPSSPDPRRRGPGPSTPPWIRTASPESSPPSRGTPAPRRPTGGPGDAAPVRRAERTHLPSGNPVSDRWLRRIPGAHRGRTDPIPAGVGTGPRVGRSGQGTDHAPSRAAGKAACRCAAPSEPICHPTTGDLVRCCGESRGRTLSAPPPSRPANPRSGRDRTERRPSGGSAPMRADWEGVGSPVRLRPSEPICDPTIRCLEMRCGQSRGLTRSAPPPSRPAIRRPGGGRRGDRSGRPGGVPPGQAARPGSAPASASGSSAAGGSRRSACSSRSRAAAR